MSPKPEIVHKTKLSEVKTLNGAVSSVIYCLGAIIHPYVTLEIK